MIFMQVSKPLSKFAELQNPVMVQEKFGIAIGDLSRAWQDKLNQRLKPLGFSPAQWRALWYLSRVPDGMAQGELARMLGSDAPSITRLAKALEQDGWIERHSLPADARCKMLHLTPKAQTVARTINQRVAPLRSETVGQLSEQQAAQGLAAISLLQGLLDRL
jgi:MarR family transcriptional regulator, transcriptional regulator for hemolysin